MNLPTFDLQGRVAIVTGASKGMGRAIASILAQAGARVVVSSRTQADCDKVAAEISLEKGQNIGIAADMSDPASIKALVETTAAKVGPPDIVVANAAGEVPVGPSAQLDLDALDRIMATNVRNNLLLANLVLPGMAERKYGSFIIMSSIVGSRGSGFLGAYAMTKAAVNQLVRNLAVEWGPQQVRINAIAPTAVRTDFSRVLWEKPEAMAKAVAKVPMGRIGEAEDVAGTALLLASPAGAFINGQVIGVDGGASAW
jgi:dehydrogenase/reductase SDR family protein 4